MFEYYVEIDAMQGLFQTYVDANNIDDAKEQVKDILIAEDGGHADIFDEEGEFVDYVEIDEDDINNYKN